MGLWLELGGEERRDDRSTSITLAAEVSELPALARTFYSSFNSFLFPWLVEAEMTNGKGGV